MEIAKNCLEKSKSEQLTCLYLDEMANSLEMLLEEARDKCAQIEVTYDYLYKLIKRFLLIVSRVARLLECIEFDPLEFYFLIDSTEQQARQQAINTDLPKYIFSKLGIGKDPFDKFNNKATTTTSEILLGGSGGLFVGSAAPTSQEGAAKFFGNIERMSSRGSDSSDLAATATTTTTSDLFSSSDLNSLGASSCCMGPPSFIPIQPPCEDDFEKIKLISNGAYGAVYLVRHRQLGERFAMKKIKKHNIILRNQVQQVNEFESIIILQLKIRTLYY